MFYGTGLWQFFSDKERILQFIQSCGIWDVVVFIFFQAVQVIVAPIPGEVLDVLGGYLYGTIVGVAWSTIGTTIGAYVAFALSRKYGKPFVEKLVDIHTMKRFDYVLHHKGAFLVFLLFLIPGFPKDYLCYILGLGHLSTMQFLVIASSGRLLGTVLGTMGGSYIRHEQYQNLFILIGIATAVLLVAMVFKEKIERALRIWRVMEFKKQRASAKKNVE